MQIYKKSKQSNINKFLWYANEKFIRVWWLFVESERAFLTYRKHIFSAKKKNHIHQAKIICFPQTTKINIINITEHTIYKNIFRLDEQFIYYRSENYVNKTIVLKMFYVVKNEANKIFVYVSNSITSFLCEMKYSHLD